MCAAQQNCFTVSASTNHSNYILYIILVHVLYLYLVSIVYVCLHAHVYVEVYVGCGCLSCRDLRRVVRVCVCVFPGGDETLSLTRCCSVKVKPYRMSGMMTRTERFRLIPPFPLFPSVPPNCPPSQTHTHTHQPPSSPCSFKRQDRHIPAFTYNLQSQLLMGVFVYVCVRKQCQVMPSH